MVNALIVLAALIAGVAFLLALRRFVAGPSRLDRVAAFDVLTIISISFIVLAALIEERAVYLDVALVYALLSFLGVIVIARYIEGKFDGTDDSRN
jgi:multicomponent Na+:H+ antiporter subunit F